MTERLSRSDSKAMAREAARFERRAATARKAGLDEDGDAFEAKAQAYRDRLDEDREARREEDAERWERERRAKEDRARREREAEERREAAGQFLADLFAAGQPVEVGTIFELARAKGIADADLLHAAGRLDLRRKAWLKSGTLSLPDRSRGIFWGPEDDFGPMLDLGRPRPPAA